MADSEEVLRCISLLPNAPEELTAFLLKNEKETIIAVFNPTTNAVTLPLPDGKWEVFVENDRSGDAPFFCVSGEATVEALSAFLAVLSK